MFSTRLSGQGEPNRLAALLARKRAEHADVLDLTISNPTEAGFRYESERIRAALSQPGVLRYLPDPRGIRHARAAVAAYYGGAFEPDNLLLTASTSEAYAWLFKLLCDAGDEVLVPRPSYPLFEYLAELESVRLVQYPLFYDHGWHVDVAEVERLAGQRTRAIVVVNPNNPTGSFLKRQELEILSQVCSAHGMALISDEVFADYAFGEDPERARAADAPVLAFTLSGLSKVAGLPQLKLGWMAVTGPAAAEALCRLDIIADTYLSVSTPVQVAAAELLGTAPALQAQIRERTAANLHSLQSQLDVLLTEGGWSAVIRLPRTRSEEEWVMSLLGEADVLVQPGWFYDFGTEPLIVVSLLTPPAVLAAAVGRMRAIP